MELGFLLSSKLVGLTTLKSKLQKLKSDPKKLQSENDEVVVEDGVKSFFIDNQLRMRLLDLAQSVEYENQLWLGNMEENEMEIGPSDSDAHVIFKGTQEHDHLVELLSPYLPYCKFNDFRLNRYSPDQFMGKHTDSGYPDHNTFTVRLDSNSDSRLVVKDDVVNESPGLAWILPPNTIHSVNEGKTYRYSLSTWFVEESL